MTTEVDKLLNKTAVLDNGCWRFTGGLTGAGYGAIDIGNRKQRSAHVVAYEFYNGPIADGVWVLHTCDNKWCVNPDHLFLGDNQANKDDEIAKGRHVKGSRQGQSKLKESDVLRIKARLSAGDRVCDIAREYDVSWTAIGWIRSGQNWGWLR